MTESDTGEWMRVTIYTHTLTMTTSPELLVFVVNSWFELMVVVP